MSIGLPHRKFVFRPEHLSEADVQVEMLCGVIMVLVLIGYLKWSLAQDDFEFKKLMILVPLGGNAAWGLIDGIMYVLANLRERGNKSKLLSLIKSSKDHTDALALVRKEFDFEFFNLLNQDTQKNIYEEIVKGLTNATIVKPRGISKNDLRVVLKTFLIVFSSGVPIVIPFFFLTDVWLAIQISQIIGLVMLFCIGYWWAKFASRHRIRSAIGVTILGVVIVGVTQILHG